MRLFSTRLVATDERAVTAMETMDRPRSDALPENTDYADTSCDLYPSCLQCPLPHCRYDEAGGAAAMLRTGMDATILRLAQVLAASIRHPLHVMQSALAGAHVATIPPSILPQMLKHPLTDLGIQRFLEDAKTAGLI